MLYFSLNLSEHFVSAFLETIATGKTYKINKFLPTYNICFHKYKYALVTFFSINSQEICKHTNMLKMNQKALLALISEDFGWYA